jgi:hypothetical protein
VQYHYEAREVELATLKHIRTQLGVTSPFSIGDLPGMKHSEGKAFNAEDVSPEKAWEIIESFAKELGMQLGEVETDVDPQVTTGIIYALVDAREPHVYRYIGQTFRPDRRLRQHSNTGRSGYEMIVLRDVPVGYLALAEAACIADALRAGHPLENFGYRYESGDKPGSIHWSLAPFPVPNLLEE